MILYHMCEKHTQSLIRGMPPQFSQTFCTACTQYEIRLLTSCQRCVNKAMSVWTGTNRSCEQMSFVFFILDVLSFEGKGQFESDISPRANNRCSNKQFILIYNKWIRLEESLRCELSIIQLSCSLEIARWKL